MKSQKARIREDAEIRMMELLQEIDELRMAAETPKQKAARAKRYRKWSGWRGR